MTKVFCDICQDEINPTEMSGKFTFVERNYTFGIKGIPKKGAQSQLMQKEQVFCEECTTKIKNFNNGLAKEKI